VVAAIYQFGLVDINALMNWVKPLHQ
jgi:hypothetical protein